MREGSLKRNKPMPCSLSFLGLDHRWVVPKTGAQWTQAVPQERRGRIPDYIKDYLSLNQFM